MGHVLFLGEGKAREGAEKMQQDEEIGKLGKDTSKKGKVGVVRGELIPPGNPRTNKRNEMKHFPGWTNPTTSDNSNMAATDKTLACPPRNRQHGCHIP